MQVSSLHREFRRYILAERGLRPNTLRDILVIVRRLCSFADTDELSMLPTTTVKDFLHHGRLELGWGARTFHLYWQYLKTFFAWCQKAGYIKINPVESIEKPRLPQRLPRCLSHDQAQRLLWHAGNGPAPTELQRTRNEAIVATFLMTGIRRKELLNLRCTDLDLGSATLLVRGGKGSKDRSIPLHPRLLPILRRSLEEKRISGVESEWFFSSTKSEMRLTNKNLYAILAKITRASGVKFTPHMLRHTFGRELVESDFNIYKLKEIMGHASVTTTQTYVALSHQSIKSSFEQTKIY